MPSLSGLATRPTELPLPPAFGLQIVRLYSHIERNDANQIWMGFKHVLRVMLTWRRNAAVACLCLMLGVSMFVPSSHHSQKIAATVVDHIEMIADHGHSHGFLEDLIMAANGHNPDVPEHDHSQVFLLPGQKLTVLQVNNEAWLPFPMVLRDDLRFGLDRPPRA